MKTPFKTLALAILMTGCKQTAAPVISSVETGASLPSVHKQFACLPEEAAFIAAHRGVSKGKGMAENSKSALEALMTAGFLFAEIDIVGLKDGTHTLYHDGVWETKSTGKGAVAASDWAQVSTFLLNDTEGKLTSDRPISLPDYLALAKDRIYLEIDFKSSAKYEIVIEALRDAGMADQVILIGYNTGQAKRLAQLAPEMMISASVNQIGDIKTLNVLGLETENIAAWRGRSDDDGELVKTLKARNIPVLKMVNRDIRPNMPKEAGLIVSDYALDVTPIVGLTKPGRTQYEACLKT